MPFSLNLTTDYHRGELQTLGWELTVSNALYPKDSPCRSVLKVPSSYGNHLYDYLCEFVSLSKIERILEVGGGYGYLMRDLLECNPRFSPLMVDISPVLMQKQKETLKDFNVIYQEGDFLECDDSLIADIELAVMNEILGDFPTALDVPTDILDKNISPKTLEYPLQRIRRLYDEYSLGSPDKPAFNFNLGALEAVEKLCRAGIPTIFLGEHSCEASVPENFARFISVTTSDNPQRIDLKGHAEYTIKMSYLQQVAEAFQYRVIRGPFADFLDILYSDSLLSFLMSRSVDEDRQEIILHFLEDLFQYEYLILLRPRTCKQ
jgi:hypothetical protein